MYLPESPTPDRWEEIARTTQCTLNGSQKQVRLLFAETEALKKKKQEMADKMKEMEKKIIEMENQIGDVCEHGGFLAVKFCSQCKTG